jgi:hypothetical protein
MKTLRLFGVALVLALTLAAAQMAGLSGMAPTAHAQAFTAHDNTTASHNWTHADPNTLDPPGFGKAGDGYYYLKMKAAGTAVWCEVYTGGDWDIALENGNKHVLAETHTSGVGGRVFITNAKPGNLYMCRIANIGNLPERDYAELNSGNPGDVTNSDCGGPGAVVDPNFDAAPMEPLETPGMPINGCAQRTTVPYVAGDPRLVFPSEEAFTLGTNKGNPTYSLTTQAACDLTAATFFGNQGHAGTLTITDASGAVVNGRKWGAAEANPGVMTQEFVGADAGVLAPGTYHVHYNGPSNGHAVYAVCQGV